MVHIRKKKKNLLKKIATFGNSLVSPVVRTQYFHCLGSIQVQSLVGELRSHNHFYCTFLEGFLQYCF